MDSPVMKEESSERRKEAMPAISCASPAASTRSRQRASTGAAMAHDRGSLVPSAG